MSQDNTNPNPKQEEEVDLGQLFNAIGQVFNKIYLFVFNILNGIFEIVLKFIKTLIKYFKLITVVFLASLLLGIVAEKIKPQSYYSGMLLKPYFDTKYQLVSNIDYYNALISDKNYPVLSEIFSIDEEASKSLLSFEIKPGPETENEKIKQYDLFINSIDSVRAQDVSYEDFVENRNIYNGELFLVEVNSTEKDVFKNLETGFYSTFENEYSKSRMEKRDLSIDLKKKTLLKSIKSIDSLKNFYVDIKKMEVEKNLNSVSLADNFLPVQQEKIDTKEFDLLKTERRLRDSILKLDELKAVEDVYFDVVSGFQVVGTKSNVFTQKYSIVFPIFSMLLMFFSFFMINLVKFVNNYKFK
ncbi:MAG: hypothetical protein BM564_02275 [Bacteroidetes bacterium MedPE-SWsnd-G2]|nr:MAG: hypothetical protein BM564_02275 [Bacteroidetes bacterium MedPE-SWsnd-G2]